MRQPFYLGMILAAAGCGLPGGACRAADLTPSATATSWVPPGTASTPAGGDILPALAADTDRPAPFVLPPPPPYPDVTSTFWIGSPLLDRPGAEPPGFLFNVESSVLWFHPYAHLVGGNAVNYNVGGFPSGGMPVTGDIVNFPLNPLRPTATPRIELGYRLPDGFGEFRISYRSIATTGADTILVQPPQSTDTLGPASQRGRLNINVIDLDFGMRQFALGPNWEMRFAIGGRLATAFLDSQVDYLAPVTVTGTPFGTGPFTRLTQSSALNNQYIGPHDVQELGRKLGVPGLTAFGRVDAAGLYGNVNQTFKETFVQPPGVSQHTAHNGVGTPWAAFQVGLSYAPASHRSRFLVGYQYEQWWQFARGDNDLSFGSLRGQGIFLRFEKTF